MVKKYEDAIKELEKISLELESGNLPLEDAILAFEKSIELGKHCLKIISEGNGKIVALKKQLDEVIETPIDMTKNK